MTRSDPQPDAQSDPKSAARPKDPGVRLMLAYQAGQEEAFDELVESYSGQVFALVTRFLGSRPNREDIVQEVFLRVIRAREKYRPAARFSTWLYRITYNICVNETQRAAPSALRLVSGSERDVDTPAAGTADAAALVDSRLDGPSETLEREDVVTAVRRAIESLPEKQRMALVLAKYHEQSHAEIALALDSTEQAIKSLVHRARETLRERLAPFMQEERT